MTLQLARRTRHTSFPKSYRSLIKIIHDIISCNYRSDGNVNCQHFFQDRMNSRFWRLPYFSFPYITVLGHKSLVRHIDQRLWNEMSSVKMGHLIFPHKKVFWATTWICMYIVMPWCTFFFNMKTVYIVFPTSHLLKVKVFSV